MNDPYLARSRTTSIAACVVVSLACGLAACSPKPDAAATADATAAAAASDARFVAMARGRVDVPGGLLRVTSVQGGAVQRWSVKPGDSVTQGQVLAQLDTREANNVLQQAKVEQAHAELALRRGNAARQSGARYAEVAAGAAEAGSARHFDEQRHVVQCGQVSHEDQSIPWMEESFPLCGLLRRREAQQTSAAAERLDPWHSHH